MRDIWSFLLQTLTASGVAALLLAAKALFRDKLSPRWQFSVWGILAVILLVPAGLGGRYALVNWSFYIEAVKSALTGEFGTLSRVTAPVPLPPAAPPHTAEDWLFLVYLAGVAALLAHYGIAYACLRRALKRGRAADPSPIRAVAERYGLQACPVVEIEGLPSAFVCGVFRPVLALPAGGAVDEKVLLHELLHLQYRDAAWGLALCFFRCLHWCNPLLWLCAGLAGNDLESLCDQRVLERLEGEDRRDYGRILLSMADERYARAPGTSSMANGGKNIRRRIEAIARFKKYPAGMGLVSVCVLLLLAVPLAVGAKAPVSNLGLGGFAAADFVAADFVYARTVYCTTCAGAFDTYAKAVITGRIKYRVMCAPLAEQNNLAETYGRPGSGGWMEEKLDELPNGIDRSCGYQICNLVQVGENTYEGLLAMALHDMPEGVEWNGTAATRWIAVQPLWAEKEGNRWVVIPQGDLEAVQGDMQQLGYNRTLPCLTYEAQWEDLLVRERWRTTSRVDSYEQVSSGFRSTTTFSTTPQPDGEFTSWFDQELSVTRAGGPEERMYGTVGLSCMPLWGDEEHRPALRDPGPVNSSGGSSTGEDWGTVYLPESGETIVTGGGMREGVIDPPAAYAADLYLNEEKAGSLTLYPVKGGLDLD